MLAENGRNSVQVEPRTLFIGADLPYFPGKMGVDFFNLRYLAQSHRVSVVGLRYEVLPVEGINNLKKTADACYLWPENVAEASVTTEPIAERVLRYPLSLLSRRALAKIWTRIVSIDKRPVDAFHHLLVLSNLAPYLIAALREQKPNTIVLLQSGSEPWLQFLPRFAAKFVYFHDVRADFEEKRQRIRAIARDDRLIEALKLQEKSLLNSVDGAAFVSERDLQIARGLYSPETPLSIAPIPIDIEYYCLPSTPVRQAKRPSVLFTGHLGHPPNIDAVEYFLDAIWPGVLKRVPTAQFIVVGAFPDSRLTNALEKAPHAVLHRDVPDIRPYFEQATVYVVPMRFGGGVRQKILEAWSMKRPVIATSMAVEGISVEHGKQVWLEDAPEAFATRVADILDGRLETAAMIEHNRSFVEKHYRIEATANQFEAAVNAARHRAGRRPFKVLFDFRWMEIGRAGGIEQLAYELASSISKLDSTNEYRFYGPRSTLLDWQFPTSFKRRLYFSDAIAQRMRDFGFESTDALAEATTNPRFLNREMRFLKFVNDLDFDLVHSFQGFTYPEFHGFPSVLTFPDLQHLAYPEFFSKEAFDTREKLFRASLEHADHVICISRFTLEEVHRHYGVPREKMSVIWITPSRSCRIRLEPNQQKRVLRKLQVDFRFLFFPAHNWPHKNHVRLLEAFARAQPNLPSDVRLVLTGGTADQRVNLPKLAKKMGLAGRIHHLGYVTPLQLAALFGGAHALIFPSLFEGFGMPVAEAILTGCPVACSNSSSLPEIAGDAALLFDPCSIESIAAAIGEITLNQKLRNELRDKAAQRQPMFSTWTPAIKTIEIYHRIFRDRFS
jgi:glycosyltransferase involved in cell wall biosynthesis